MCLHRAAAGLGPEAHATTRKRATAARNSAGAPSLMRVGGKIPPASHVRPRQRRTYTAGAQENLVRRE
jgi:hypothetical protein